MSELLSAEATMPRMKKPRRSAQVAWARYVTLPLAAKITGLSEEEMRRRISAGEWQLGVHYFQPERLTTIVDWERVGTARPEPTARAPRAPRTIGATHLYRHFNAAGELLYVGISLNALVRLGAHAKNAAWFAAIARVDVESFPSREAATAAEKAAIQNERPLHNIVHAEKR